MDVCVDLPEASRVRRFCSLSLSLSAFQYLTDLALFRLSVSRVCDFEGDMGKKVSAAVGTAV